MKVSYICVTNRPHFAEAVRAQYRAQRWADKELIVVDSSECGGIIEDEADTYLRTTAPLNVGSLRNLGLAAATGDAIMWLDDDDWRHPNLTSVLARRMKDTDAPMVGMSSTFWIDLEGGMNRRGRHPWPIFAASLYRNVRPMPTFRTKPPYKTDSYWILRAFKHYGGEENVSTVNWPRLYVIVNHGGNVHNPSLRDDPGPWTETDAGFLPASPDGLSAHMERIRGAS